MKNEWLIHCLTDEKRTLRQDVEMEMYTIVDYYTFHKLKLDMLSFSVIANLALFREP